ncbi:MAG: hypothetical protein R3C11_18430 [Planctomycetaceae bacterium]
MVSLPQSRLQEQWVRNGVHNVANDLIRFRNEPADVGALYHAVDALVIYKERNSSSRRSIFLYRHHCHRCSGRRIGD